MEHICGQVQKRVSGIQGLRCTRLLSWTEAQVETRLRPGNYGFAVLIHPVIATKKNLLTIAQKPSFIGASRKPNKV